MRLAGAGGMALSRAHAASSPRMLHAGCALSPPSARCDNALSRPCRQPGQGSLPAPLHCAPAGAPAGAFSCPPSASSQFRSKLLAPLRRPPFRLHWNGGEQARNSQR